jgi:hypothetical protein
MKAPPHDPGPGRSCALGQAVNSAVARLNRSWRHFQGLAGRLRPAR